MEHSKLELEGADEEIKSLREELDERKQSEKTLLDERARLQAVNARMDKELDSYKSMVDKHGAVKAQLKNLQVRGRRPTRSLSLSLSLSLSHSFFLRFPPQNEVVEQRKENHELQKRIESLQTESAAKTEVLQGVEARLAEKTEEAASWKEQLQSLEHDHQRRLEELTVTRQRQASLSEREREREGEVSEKGGEKAMSERTAKAEREAAELRSALQSAEEAARKAESKEKAIETEMDAIQSSMTAELKAAQDEIERLRRQLEEERDSEKRGSSQTGAVSEERERETGKAGKSDIQLEDALKRAEKAESALTEALAAAKGQEKEREQLLTRQLRSYEQEIERLREAASRRAEGRGDAELEGLSKAVAELEEENTRLRQALNARSTRLQVLNEAMMQKEQLAEERQREHEAEVEELREAIQILQAEKAGQEEALHQARDRIASLEEGQRRTAAEEWEEKRTATASTSTAGGRPPLPGRQREREREKEVERSAEESAVPGRILNELAQLRERVEDLSVLKSYLDLPHVQTALRVQKTLLGLPDASSLLYYTNRSGERQREQSSRLFAGSDRDSLSGGGLREPKSAWDSAIDSIAASTSAAEARSSFMVELGGLGKSYEEIQKRMGRQQKSVTFSGV